MATSLISRSLLSKSLTTLFSRTFKTSTLSLSPPRPSLSLLNRLRPLAAAANLVTGSTVSPNLAARAFSTRPASSSLNDPNPNWSNRPPKETIMLDGCDFEHWLVVVDKPEGDVTRDDIIDMYIKTLAQVVGSEEEARMKIYSVSTRCYFAFGANVSEEISYKLKDLPGVRWVLPDSYLDVRNKDYGGEPFINGQAVPYDPKYHEEWIRNNNRATDRNKKNDRPRSFDRSRNFERRRDNTRAAPNMGGMPPQNNMGGMPPQNNMGGMPPQNNMGGMPPQNMGGMPPQNNMGGMPPQNNMRGMPPQNNMGGMPQHNMPQHNNMGGMPPNMGVPPNAGWSGNMQNYQNSGPNPGGMPYQGATPNTQFQNNYSPNRDGPSGNPY